MIKLRLFVFAIAIATAAANFFIVHFMLGAGVMGLSLIPGLADLRPTWNHGVSFGLLTQDSATGCHLLIGLLMAVAIFVAAMAWRASTLLAAIGYGLILGGAFGNISDRLPTCAVFDFLDLHVGRIPLFVCNFADIAISAGVVLLFADFLIAKRSAP